MSKTGTNTEKSMAKVVRFINNYPNDWIQKAFADDKHLAQHLESKWKGYSGKETSREAIVALMSTFDSENERKLMEYIDATFEKGGEIKSWLDDELIPACKPL
jgi:hypothetical protein